MFRLLRYAIFFDIILILIYYYDFKIQFLPRPFSAGSLLSSLFILKPFVKRQTDDVEFSHFSQVDIPSEPEDDEDDPDGRFAFKRKRGVKYMAVSWTSLLFAEIICSGGFISKWGTRSPMGAGWGWWGVGGVVGGFQNNRELKQ